MAENMDRREFMKTAGAGMASMVMAGRHCGAKARRSDRPNILVILLDDLGYGDLSSYGAHDLHTPHIDALVSAGMRWNNFYANCPVCSPTRASLLTGRYPDMVGVPGVIRTHQEESWGYLSPAAVLLPRLLKPAGYHTALVGKWHLGLGSPNLPNERGFDHFHGFLGDMMDDYYTHRRFGKNYMRRNDTEIDPPGHATDLFSDWAIDYLDSRADAAEPFFLYLAYNAPHTPIQPPKEWLEKVTERERNISPERAKIVALIEHLDQGIGRVMQALEDNGLRQDTLVILASDNGGQLSVEGNNGCLRGGKEDMYEGGLRVPMCAAWPGQISAGTRTDQVGLTMDLFATLCDAAGVRVAHNIDGVSLLPVLKDPTHPLAERFLFWVRREGHIYGGKSYHAARCGPWKLLQNSPYEPLQLFNLESDPLESKPFGREHGQYKKLFTALLNHINRAGAIPWNGTG